MRALFQSEKRSKKIGRLPAARRGGSLTWAVWAALLATRLALAHGDLHAQIDTLTRQLEREPGNAELHLRRGELHRLHQDRPAAEADFARAEQLNAKLAAVDFCRGKLFFDAGLDAKARVFLDKYLERRPDDAHALVTRARVLVKLGERRAAASDFTRAIGLLPEPQPDHFLERARAVAEEGHVEDALRGLDEGIRRLGALVTL